MLRNLLAGLLIILTLIIFSCKNDFTPDENQFQDDPPPLSWTNKFFEPELIEGGLTRTILRTNDRQYWTYEGFTMWTAWGNANTPFVSRTVSMVKPSGYSGGGYGIVFCQSEHEINGVLTPVMLVVMINNDGEYLFGKTIGGIFVDFSWWKTTPYLNKRTDSANELTVFYDNSTDEFCIQINGYEIERFRDDNEPLLRSGKNGYIAVITPFDNFPVTGIDIYFMEEL